MGTAMASPAAFLFSANANRSFLADIEVDATVDIAAIFRCHAAPPERLSARWIRGAKVPTRIVATSHAFPLLIHESVGDAFVAAGIEGWKPVPVDLLNARGEPFDGYHLLTVRGRCGPVAASGDGTLYFERDSWDGCDMFVPDGTTNILVTPRAQRVIDALRERHVRLAPVRWAHVSACAE